MASNFYCNRCGAVNLYGQGQCVNCGQPFYYSCPQCGANINNTCASCPGCRMPLLWPGQETISPPQAEYREYNSSKGMNPVLKGALILAGIIVLFAAAFFTINSLHKTTTSSLPVQSSSQNPKSTQQGPSQSNSNSSGYQPPDNAFNSKPYAPPDNAFNSKPYKPPDNTF
jgi:hypothetical protein